MKKKYTFSNDIFLCGFEIVLTNCKGERSFSALECMESCLRSITASPD
jgi:hypothetical protein